MIERIRRWAWLLPIGLASASFALGCSLPVAPCDIVIASSDVPDVERVAPDAVILATAADVDPTDWKVTEDGNGLATVELRLRPGAAERFAEHTAANVGGYLAIVVNGTVVSTPTIMSAIDDGALAITGGPDDDVVEAFGSCLPIELRPPV